MARSIFRLSQPAYKGRTDPGALGQLQGVAQNIPQMPTLQPGAAGTMIMQAPSPALGISILQSQMDQQARQRQQDTEDARWKMTHLSDLARLEQYGAPDGEKRLQAPSIPSSLESLKDPLAKASQIYDQTMAQTYGDHQQATERMRFFLDHSPEYKTQMSAAEHRGASQAAHDLLPQELVDEQAKAQVKLQVERQKMAQQGAFDLRQGARLFGQQRSQQASTHDADFQQTLNEARKMNDVQEAHAAALAKIKEQYGQGENALSLQDALKLDGEVTKDLYENRGWTTDKVAKDPTGFKAAHQELVAGRLQGARRTVDRTKRSAAGSVRTGDDRVSKAGY